MSYFDTIMRRVNRRPRRAALAAVAHAHYYQAGTPPPGNHWSVPGSGYTPPITPGSPYSRQNGPPTLRQRARYDSRAWWKWQALKGLLMGGFIFATGLITVGFAQSRSGLECLTILGVVAMFMGGAVLLIHLLAPWVLTWAVEVPANHYWRVETLNGARTRGFIAPGLMAMQIKTNARIVTYVDFVVLQVIEIVYNIFETTQAPMNIEVVAIVRFDPTQAEEEAYDTLRQMTQRSQFEAAIRRQIQSAVRAHMRRRDPMRTGSLQDTLHHLESAIARDLNDMQALGLQPEAVSVNHHIVGVVPDDMRRMWDRGPNTPHESELVSDLADMMQRFGLTFEQAVHYYGFLKRGFQLPVSGADAPSGSVPPGPPPKSAPASPADHVSDQTRMHPAAEPTQFNIAEPDQQPSPEGDTILHTSAPAADETRRTTTDDLLGASKPASRTIRNPEDVPDPMDRRDKRRDARRKPKND